MWFCYNLNDRYLKGYERFKTRNAFAKLYAGQIRYCYEERMRSFGYSLKEYQYTLPTHSIFCQ